MILALIPARKNSKSVSNKNMKFLAGKPLIHYAITQAKKSKKPKKQAKRQDDTPRPQNQFSFGFGNMENFGYDMFSNKKKLDSKEEPKQQGFNFGFGNSEIPLDEMFDFRVKKKKSSIDDVWNPRDFWQ